MYQDIDRVLYRVAAMTGLRLGELLALRWRDVDWVAGVIRVRRNYVRGRYGTPKSRRSSRAVPMADEVGGVLDRLFQASAFQGDDDHVFAHPATGKAIPKANVTRRLHKALADAELDQPTCSTTCATRSGPRWPRRGADADRAGVDGAQAHLTTERYADYAPRATEGEMISAAFADPAHIRPSECCRSPVSLLRLADTAVAVSVGKDGHHQGVFGSCSARTVLREGHSRTSVARRNPCGVRFTAWGVRNASVRGVTGKAVRAPRVLWAAARSGGVWSEWIVSSYTIVAGLAAFVSLGLLVWLAVYMVSRSRSGCACMLSVGAGFWEGPSPGQGDDGPPGGTNPEGGGDAPPPTEA